MNKDELIKNISRIHTTKLGVERIKRNISVYIDDVVEWCKNTILNKNCIVKKKGKNWYALIDDIIITINANSYTIITVKKK